MKPINRRTFLRGAGVTLALPFLPSLTRAAEAKPPVRFATLMMPNGVHPKMWTPEGEGRDFTLSPTLEPLGDFRDSIQVLTHLGHKACLPGDGHYVKTAGFLTGTTITKTVGVDLNCNGVSLDQVCAQKVAGQTPLPSLELGIEPVHSGVDGTVGYTRIYGAHIAWAGPTKPLAKEIQPRWAFERLARVFRPAGETRRPDRSIIDLVLADAKSVQGKLGSADGRKLDEYLDSVRSLERRIERSEGAGKSPWTPRATLAGKTPPPEAVPKEHTEHVRLMLDLMVLAFQTDVTRVATFMFGNSVSGIDFSFLPGVKGGHHGLSHHENDADKLRQYQLINRWHIEQMAYFLGKLRSVQDGERNLLDNSMILFGSDLRDGNAHSPRDLPLVLAGRAGGKLAAGQHRVYAKDTPLANLFVSMLEAFGAPQPRFADSTGALAGVLV